MLPAASAPGVTCGDRLVEGDDGAVDDACAAQPRALPRATTAVLTASFDESPVLIVLSPDTPWICSTATSSAGSVPTTFAVYVFPVVTTVTLMLVAPATTWLLVST